MSRGTDKAPSLWLVEDNPDQRAQTVADLRSLKLSVLEIGTLEEFDRRVARTTTGERAPDVVIVDLRLGWSSKDILAVDPIRDGLLCIESLKTNVTTSSTPIVVYSAFVYDELIANRLTPYRPLVVVDKIDRERLKLTLANLGVARPRNRRLTGIRQAFFAGERRLLRIGALIGAVTVTAGALIWLTRLFL